MTNIEKWRIERGLTYADIADMTGVSRQYAHVLCTKGTAGIIKAVRLILVSNGQLDIMDFLSDADRRQLVLEGFLPGDAEETYDDEYAI